MPTLKQLSEALQAAGKETIPVSFDDGTQLLIMPFGGRMLGLFAGDSSPSFLFSQGALADPQTAKTYLSRPDAWPNPGGDRTWLAPEAEVIITNPGQPNQTYRVPPELDPGHYTATKKDGIVQLTNEATIKLLNAHQQANVRITKRWLPAPNPMRLDKPPAGLSYAGYTQETMLEILSASNEKTMLGLWNLLQMPHGGKLFIRTYSASPPLTVFGDVPPADIEVTDHEVRYAMRAPTTAKIGVRDVATTGRVGYVYRTDERTWNLVMRNFFVNPSGEYIDQPWKNRADIGWSVQACSANEPTEQFSELEYHVPAIGAGQTSVDRSQVWAFRGARDGITAVMNRLLGSEI